MSDTTDSRPPTGSAWTADRIRALGLTTDIATAADIFGIGRSTAYELIRDGDFPLPVVRFGSKTRIPVAAILHALQLDVEIPAADPASPPSEPGAPATDART
jgi:excisionase family DNA binding protein